MSKLILRYPDNVVREVEFDQPKYRIGADPDNDLVLEGEEVEAHQAEINTTEGGFSIVDVSEGKTTTVNGKQIERVNLNYGDRISFGPIIGLFYPSQKTKVGVKTKLFLYLLAGGLVIILSIVFFFILTSKRLSNVVSGEIGPIVSEEEMVRKETERQRGEERDILFEEEEEIEGIKREKPEKGFLFIKRKSSVLLVLPEPSLDTIQARGSIAIPRGVKKLFFKKIPVSVGESIPSEEQAALEEEHFLPCQWNLK